MASESTPLVGAPASAPASDETRSFRKRVYDEVHGESAGLLESAILYLIFATAFFFVIGTLNIGIDKEGGQHIPCSPPPAGQDVCQKLSDIYAGPLDWFEFFAVVIFSVEYAARLYSVVEAPEYKGMSPILARLKWGTTFLALIDIVAILPWYLGKIFSSFADTNAQALRAVRMVRLLKAEKYVSALSMLSDVLEENHALLMAAGFYSLLALLFSATALYYTEQSNGLESEMYFQSIPEAMFPCVLMLTGEFPVADFTPLGQFIAATMAVVAVAIFAVPTGVLGSGFVKAVQKAKHLEFSVDI